MTETLENHYLQLTLNPGNNTWSISSVHAGHARLNNAGWGVGYSVNGRRGRSSNRLQLAVTRRSDVEASPHGPHRLVELRSEPDEQGLALRLELALPGQHPFLIWRYTLENHSSQPVSVDGFELMQAGYPDGEIVFPDALHAAHRQANRTPSPAFFSQGWQSWSYTGVYGPGERMKRIRLGPFRAPTEIDQPNPRLNHAGKHTSQMFGVLGDRSSRSAVLVGFLSQQQHFGVLEAQLASPHPALRLWAHGDHACLAAGGEITTDWACLQFLHLDEVDPLGSYLEAVARQHGLSDLRASEAEIPTGWCSWYQYSDENYIGRLTDNDLRVNLAAMQALHADMPLSIFQIDDGYEKQVGDWLSCAPGFPDGMAPLAAEIRTAGFTPGLWLAPFVVHPKSELAARHPDWLLRSRSNRPVNAGFFWNTFAAALDLTHPEALAYAAQVVHTAVHAWDYPYLKLDFLYAAALPGKYRDPSVTRARALRLGLEALRSAAGDQAYLLGCSCPLGPAIGLVDGMRIGTDTARRWRPSFAGFEMFFDQEPNLPAARTSLHNAVTRAPLHRRWWVNDPDCLLLREQTQLTLTEVQTAATVIALTGGAVMLSDDLTRLSEDRLQIARVLLPVIGSRARALDWFDASTPARLRLDLENESGRWHLLAGFNWNDQPQEPHLMLGDFALEADHRYFVREFWTGKAYLVRDGCLPVGRIPAHGVRLFAVRRAASGEPLYLGSSLHISQGLEICKWEARSNELSVGLKRPGLAEGVLTFSFPEQPEMVLLDGKPVPWSADPEGIDHIEVKFNQVATLNIRW